MADFGLQVFGPDGSEWMGVTDRLVRILGSFVISSDGSKTDYGLATGTPFYVFVSENDSPSNDGGYDVWFSGTKINWSVDSGYSSIRVIYGVY